MTFLFLPMSLRKNKLERVKFAISQLPLNLITLRGSSVIQNLQSFLFDYCQKEDIFVHFKQSKSTELYISYFLKSIFYP